MMNNNEIFLNNKFSISNQIWLKPRKDTQELATKFQQVYEISYPLAIFLAQKDLEIDQIENFLNPRIKFSMTDPSLLLDMNNAITIITNSIINNKRIAIFADYDVDGGASAALLYKWFENFKIKPTIYIPDRDREGYGPNIEAMTKLSLDHDLIICVDCGTISDNPITKAKKNNCHVIVVDHHQGGDKNTKADALVNPNRLDEKSELKFLCAAGVTFLLVVALNRELKKFEFNVPDILLYLDLVALATVSDVVPLIKLNRAFVRSGLKIIEMGKNIGIKSLIEISKISKPINTNHIGFNIGPKINAGGRLGSPKLGVELLIEKNQDEAIKIARTLESLNENRKFLENVMIDKAASLLKKDQLKNEFIWVANKEFKPGITGIIASRLLEKYNKTSLVISIDKNGIGKGSGRSNSNHNLGNAICQLSEEKLITKGGGHAKAAGITIEEKKLRIAMNRLNEILSKLEEMKDHEFYLYSGDDPTSTQFMLSGGSGTISVTANVVPSLIADICNKALSNESKTAIELDIKLKDLNEILFVESNPIPVKWILNRLGRIPKGLRLPLVELDKKFHSKAELILKELSLLN